MWTQVRTLGLHSVEQYALLIGVEAVERILRKAELLRTTWSM